MYNLCSCDKNKLVHEEWKNYPVLGENGEQVCLLDITIDYCQNCLLGRECRQNMMTGHGWERTGKIRAVDTVNRRTKELIFSEPPRSTRLE